MILFWQVGHFTLGLLVKGDSRQKLDFLGNYSILGIHFFFISDIFILTLGMSNFFTMNSYGHSKSNAFSLLFQNYFCLMIDLVVVDTHI